METGQRILRNEKLHYKIFQSEFPQFHLAFFLAFKESEVIEIDAKGVEGLLVTW